MLLFLVIIPLVVALFLGWRYSEVPGDVGAARQAARQLANQAKALTPASLDRETVDRLAGSVVELEEALEPLERLVAEDPLVALAGSMPIAGDHVAAAESLLVAAGALTEAADVGLGLAHEIVEIREANLVDGSVPLMPGLVELMAESGAEVDQLWESLEIAQAAIEDIPDDALAQIIEARDLVQEPLAAYMPLLATYVEHGDAIPAMFGWGDEARYLVLAQNPAELRPSGGYAGTIGVVTVRDGAITEQRFRDVHELSRQEGLPFVEAPPALAEYLLGPDQSWRLADATWSPDFPTAAQAALELYTIETGDSDIDGVIAITTFAIDRLLEVVGPVEIPKYDVTVAPGDTTLTLLGATRGTPTSLEGRKEILDVLARRLMNRLLSLPPASWSAAGEALGDIGAEGMALAWMVDDGAQALIDDVGWSGRVGAGTGDTVMVVESNVSPTSKYNLVVDRSDSLVVKLDDTGNALESLRMDWSNHAAEPGEPYASLREFSNNEEGWYGAYVRVLAPDGAELVTTSGRTAEDIGAAEGVSEEAGRVVFANYLFMPPGESTLTYLWTVPAVAVPIEGGWRYELMLQKQPGARAVPQSVVVDLPPGSQVFGASDGARVEGERVSFTADLSEDVALFVEYGLAEELG